MGNEVGPYDLSGTLDSFTFLDKTIRAEKHNTDLASFQVHAHALDTGSEFDQLLGLDIAQTMDTSNTITNGQDTTSFSEASLFLYTTNSLFKDGGDFGRGGFGVGSV